MSKYYRDNVLALKDNIDNMSSKDRADLLSFLEKKNNLNFDKDDETIAIMKHLHLMQLDEATKIINHFIFPSKLDKLIRKILGHY